MVQYNEVKASLNTQCSNEYFNQGMMQTAAGGAIGSSSLAIINYTSQGTLHNVKSQGEWTGESSSRSSYTQLHT